MYAYIPCMCARRRIERRDCDSGEGRARRPNVVLVEVPFSALSPSNVTQMHVPGFGAVPETPFHKIESSRSSEFLNQTSLGCEIPGRTELADKLFETTKATTDKDLLHFSYKEAIATDGWRK